MNKNDLAKQGKLNLPQRNSIRLKGYDYSQVGYYFITICTHNRLNLFGKINHGEMGLNNAGEMVGKQWLKLPNRFPNISLHKYIIMPNHFHAIIEIMSHKTDNPQSAAVGVPLVGTRSSTPQNRKFSNEHTKNKHPQNRIFSNEHPQNGQPQGIAPTAITNTIGDIVGAFQSIVTVEYIRGVNNENWQRFNGKLWQRNYWEHIIHNENEYLRISQYIINNPQKWALDKLNGGTGNMVMEEIAEYNSEIWMV